MDIAARSANTESRMLAVQRVAHSLERIPNFHRSNHLPMLQVFAVKRRTESVAAATINPV